MQASDTIFMDTEEYIGQKSMLIFGQGVNVLFDYHDFAHGSWKALAAWYQRWQHFQIYNFLVFSFSSSSSFFFSRFLV